MGYAAPAALASEPPNSGINIHVPTPMKDRIAAVLASYFLPYQEKWIRDESRNKIAEKSRRCGLTFAEEFRRVERISAQGARYDAYITSKDEGLAKQFIRESKNFANMFGMVADDIGEVVFDRDKGHSAFALEAATGKRIYSLSSNPDQQAGRAGDRTADEYALHKEQRQLYAIMKPGTKWGGQLSIFSTHRGVGSYFNQLIKEAREGGNPKKFSLHTITLTQAVEQGLWIKIRDQLPEDDEQKQWTDEEFLQACRDEMPDEESFNQEYMCIPEDDADSYLPWELLIPVSSKTIMGIDWRTLPGPFFLGYDVARKKDLSVITLYHQIGSMLVQCADIQLGKMTFTAQQRVLHALLDDKRIKRACIDATGIGAMMAEQAAEKYGTDRVTQVMFTMASKQELAIPFKRRFEDKTITIYDDIKLHADLRSVKKMTTSAGNVIFTAEAGASDGHADRFWSHALAVNAAEGLTNPGIFARLKSLINQRDTRSRDRRRSRGAFG
ncbi:terminase large subunit domain-containing protein [Prosthecobacter sp.]|uniref:terminase large subunit domain-containing protein n=1 Tax=Prosthecobacter sp. TaxID=1965333 RepID=UPI0037842E86